MHELFPLHTLTSSLSNDPGFARPDIGRFVSIVQVFVETVCFAKSWSFSLFDSGILSFLYSCYHFDSCISHLASILFLFHLRSCVAFICIIAVIADYYGSDL